MFVVFVPLGDAQIVLAGCQVDVVVGARLLVLVGHQLLGGEVVVGGLRGHAYVSTDDAATWSALDVPGDAAIAAIETTDADRLLIGGESGAYVSDATRRHFAALAIPRLAPVNALTRAFDGAWVIATMRGVTRVERSVVVQASGKP